MKPAVFLDRDGTVIEQVHYLTEPDEVVLYEGAAEAIRSLREAGYACVIATNQSVIGRGMLSEAGLEAVHDRMCRLFEASGARFDGVYACPVAPAQRDKTVIEHPDRKPGPGMLRRAAEELDLDLPRSWMVGDMISDLLAGRNAGCRGNILVRTGHGHTVDPSDPAVDHVVDDLPAAAQLIQRLDRSEG